MLSIARVCVLFGDHGQIRELAQQQQQANNKARCMWRALLRLLSAEAASKDKIAQSGGKYDLYCEWKQMKAGIRNPATTAATR